MRANHHDRQASASPCQVPTRHPAFQNRTIPTPPTTRQFRNSPSADSRRILLGGRHRALTERLPHPLGRGVMPSGDDHWLCACLCGFAVVSWCVVSVFHHVAERSPWVVGVARPVPRRMLHDRCAGLAFHRSVTGPPSATGMTWSRVKDIGCCQCSSGSMGSPHRWQAPPSVLSWAASVLYRRPPRLVLLRWVAVLVLRVPCYRLSL